MACQPFLQLAAYLTILTNNVAKRYLEGGQRICGIVRRIDELGRIVIPKEIRRTLRIREGDPLEIYTDREGGIILKKYSPIGELAAFALDFAEALSQSLGLTAVISDRDTVLAASGEHKRDYFERPVSSALRR